MKKTNFKKTSKKKIKKAKQSSGDVQLIDSNASQGSVQKYRATFLIGQRFRGVYYEASQSIILPEVEAKAYFARSQIRFEKI